MRLFMTIATCVALVVVSDGAPARADHTAPVMISPGPQAMPVHFFDLPQSAQLKVPLGPPAGKGTGSPTVGGATVLRRTVEPIPGPGPQAAAAAQAAVAACAADGFTVAVAITDSMGNLKAALAPDGTRTNGVYMAMHKAVTVVGFKMSTLKFRTRAEKDPSLLDRVKPNMSLLPGGLPIFRDGKFVGAIATSGASAYVEEKCAKAGMAVLQADAS